MGILAAGPNQKLHKQNQLQKSADSAPSSSTKSSDIKTPEPKASLASFLTFLESITNPFKKDQGASSASFVQSEKPLFSSKLELPKPIQNLIATLSPSTPPKSEQSAPSTTTPITQQAKPETPPQTMFKLLETHISALKKENTTWTSPQKTEQPITQKTDFTPPKFLTPTPTDNPVTPTQIGSLPPKESGKASTEVPLNIRHLFERPQTESKNTYSALPTLPDIPTKELQATSAVLQTKINATLQKMDIPFSLPKTQPKIEQFQPIIKALVSHPDSPLKTQVLKETISLATITHAREPRTDSLTLLNNVIDQVISPSKQTPLETVASLIHFLADTTPDAVILAPVIDHIFEVESSPIQEKTATLVLTQPALPENVISTLVEHLVLTQPLQETPVILNEVHQLKPDLFPSVVDNILESPAKDTAISILENFMTTSIAENTSASTEIINTVLPQLIEKAPEKIDTIVSQLTEAAITQKPEEFHAIIKEVFVTILKEAPEKASTISQHISDIVSTKGPEQIPQLETIIGPITKSVELTLETPTPILSKVEQSITQPLMTVIAEKAPESLPLLQSILESSPPIREIGQKSSTEGQIGLSETQKGPITEQKLPELIQTALPIITEKAPEELPNLVSTIIQSTLDQQPQELSSVIATITATIESVPTEIKPVLTQALATVIAEKSTDVLPQVSPKELPKALQDVLPIITKHTPEKLPDVVTSVIQHTAEVTPKELPTVVSALSEALSAVKSEFTPELTQTLISVLSETAPSILPTLQPILENAPQIGEIGQRGIPEGQSIQIPDQKGPIATEKNQLEGQKATITEQLTTLPKETIVPFLQESLPQLPPKELPNILQEVVPTLIKDAPEKLPEVITAFVQHISEAAPKELPTVVSALANALISVLSEKASEPKNSPQIGEIGQRGLTEAQPNLTAAFRSPEEALPILKPVVDAIVLSDNPPIIAASVERLATLPKETLIPLLQESLSSIPTQTLPDVLQAAIPALVEHASEHLPEILSTVIQSVTENAPLQLPVIVSAIADAVTAVKTEIKAEITQTIQKVVSDKKPDLLPELKPILENAPTTGEIGQRNLPTEQNTLHTEQKLPTEKATATLPKEGFSFDKEVQQLSVKDRPVALQFINLVTEKQGFNETKNAHQFVTQTLSLLDDIKGHTTARNTFQLGLHEIQRLPLDTNELKHALTSLTQLSNSSSKLNNEVLSQTFLQLIPQLTQDGETTPSALAGLRGLAVISKQLPKQSEEFKNNVHTIINNIATVSDGKVLNHSIFALGRLLAQFSDDYQPRFLNIMSRLNDKEQVAFSLRISHLSSRIPQENLMDFMYTIEHLMDLNKVSSKEVTDLVTLFSKQNNIEDVNDEIALLSQSTAVLEKTIKPETLERNQLLLNEINLSSIAATSYWSEMATIKKLKEENARQLKGLLIKSDALTKAFLAFFGGTFNHQEIEDVTGGLADWEAMLQSIKNQQKEARIRMAKKQKEHMEKEKAAFLLKKNLNKKADE